MVNSPLEKGPHQSPTPESAGVVVQPSKTEGLVMFLDALNDQVSESAGERPGEQQGSGGGAMTTSGQQTTQTTSWRDEAIAKLPGAQIMQKQLETHIRAEVKKLRAEADHVTRLALPGSAYQAAQLWAKIRRLNALLAELFEASFDVLKRIFIRVFIDRQAIL